MHPRPEIIVLTPVYEDGPSFGVLAKEISNALSGKVYLIAIDDGSLRLAPAISDLIAANLPGEIIRLRRNVGHQRAIALGLNYISDSYPEATVVIMDSDGEDQPKTITSLLNSLSSIEIDIAVAKRKKRVVSFQFRFFYQIYKALFLVLTGKKINFGNFMALKPFAVKRMAVMQELWVHVAGAVLVSKLRIDIKPIERGPRFIGESKMNFVSLVLLGFKAFIVFSDDILVRVGITCAFLALLSLVLMPIPIYLKSIGMASPGWSSILFGVFLLVFIQACTVALLTLLLSGLSKSSGMQPVEYQSLILEIEKTESTCRN